MSQAKTQSRSSGDGRPLRGGDASNKTPFEPDPALIGQVIGGRYQIIELIGQGGMGCVYKARHTEIRRLVALKLLHPELGQLHEVSERFRREAVAVGRIEHPNCVNVFDFGALDDGSLYLVMQYLEGRSLSDELTDNVRIEPARAVRILRHVLRGLGHAHDNGIVHRDVKPENIILINHEGDPDHAKILDFGIAKLIGQAAKDHDAKLTRAGMTFGTPIYMSPEQALGNATDGRADLYAATIVAYEMISGVPPFQSSDMLEVLTMHIAKAAPPLSEVAPDVIVPHALEPLLMKGLAKRPDERYLDAQEYIDALDQLLGDAGAVVDTLIEVCDSDTIPDATVPEPPTAAMVPVLQPTPDPAPRPLAQPAQHTAYYPAHYPTYHPIRHPGHPAATTARTTRPPSLRWAWWIGMTAAVSLGILLAVLAVEPGATPNDSKDAQTALGAAEQHRLVELATTSEDNEERARAVELVKQHGLSDQVDWVKTYALDLEHGENCADRRKAIAKLRATGDRRAIKPLQRSIRRKVKAGRRKGELLNQCLKRDAKQALRALQNQSI